ncbi:hypothetical protein PG991_014373 [Apiospora marii]|uniref:Prolyl 4-hydroxylase alpha subunit Fe(2+) 2OG dioxygenase domain-containing protein n=1 Tax=Apiospora marii TaxID=335849 RepID=A0ABR1R8J9_9PEZI
MAAVHRDGSHVMRTLDTPFVRSVNGDENPQLVFPGFCRAVFGHCSEIVRFLVKNAAPEHYSLCHDIYDELSPDVRLTTGQEDFLSLFALGSNGYTQRHKDSNDVRGGLAGFITLGSYTVPYAPGACTILRGDKMDHLVTDYSGPRYFVIGTNHEAVRRWAMRRMSESENDDVSDVESQEGVVKSSRTDKESNKGAVTRDDFDDPDKELVEFPPKTPCVNTGNDWEEDEVASHEWTNEELHGAAALPLYDHSGSDPSQS